MSSYISLRIYSSEERKNSTKEEVEQLFLDRVLTFYISRKEQLGEERLNLLEHAVILQVVDEK